MLKKTIYPQVDPTTQVAVLGLCRSTAGVFSLLALGYMYESDL